MTTSLDQKRPDDPFSSGVIRCPRCKSRDMARSGREPYRYICGGCDRHFMIAMQFVEVPADTRPKMLKDTKDDHDSRGAG